MFDEVVTKAGLALSEKQRMEQRMDSLIAQDPSLHATHQQSFIQQKSKDLDTPLELSPGKEKAMYHSRVASGGAEDVPVFSASKSGGGGGKRGKQVGSGRKNNNLEDDRLDFSSDDDEAPYPAAPNRKLERVALNRPSQKGKSLSRRVNGVDDDDDDDAAAMRALALEAGLGSPGSGANSSFYDAEETLNSDDDEEDNAALFKGFTAPTIASDSVFSTQAQPQRAGGASSFARASNSSVASSATSLGPPTSTAGVRVAKPPAVPATQTTKDLSSRGVVVGKGGVFVRAGGRKAKSSRESPSLG